MFRPRSDRHWLRTVFFVIRPRSQSTALVLFRGSEVWPQHDTADPTKSKNSWWDRLYLIDASFFARAVGNCNLWLLTPTLASQDFWLRVLSYFVSIVKRKICYISLHARAHFTTILRIAVVGTKYFSLDWGTHDPNDSPSLCWCPWISITNTTDAVLSVTNVLIIARSSAHRAAQNW